MSKALIQGAATSAPQFINYNPFSREQIKKQSLERVYQDRNVRKYIDQLPAGLDLEKVPGSMHEPVENYLQQSRMRYGRLARMLASNNIQAGSPRYMQVQSEMFNIQKSFKGLSSDLDNFKNLKQEYLQDFDSGNISVGSSDSKLKELFGKDDYKVSIIDGKLNFLMDDGSFLAANQLGSEVSYFNKNAKAIDGLLALNQQAYKNAVPIDRTSDYLYRRQIQQLIGESGRDGMISLATDKFLDNPLINLDNPDDPNLWLLQEENHDQLKDFLVNNWINGISSAANQAFQLKNRASNVIGQFGGIAMDTAMQIWESGDLEQIGNLLPLDSKTKIDAYDDGTYDIKIGNRTMPFKIDPNNPDHLQLYLKALGLGSKALNAAGYKPTVSIDIDKI